MFTLTINMDSSAFMSEDELPMCLFKVRHDVEQGKKSGSVRDSNGNTVGSWEISE